MKVEQGLVKFAERQINRLIGEKKVWQEEKLAPDKKIEDLTKIIVDTANNQLADDGEWYDLGQDDIVQKGDRYRAKVGTTYSEADVWGKPASHWDNFQFQRRKPTDMLDDGTAVPGWAKGSGSWKGWDRCVGNQAMMRIVGNNTLHVNYLGELLVRHPISGHPVPMRFGAIPAAKKAADAIIAGLEAKP
ncbi:hypothetical protein EBT16_00925 [bacterium]|nr:hypothetical protein [bacterium]